MTEALAADAFWILRCERLVLLTGDPARPFPHLSHSSRPGNVDALPVGVWNGRPVLTADVEQFPGPPDGQAVPLRALHALAGDEAFALAGRAVQLLDWQRNHRYCGHCSTSTVRQSDELAMACPNCGLLVYPRISPAIMVLVKKGRELLLARSPRFKAGVFSALAGFVEAGETLEQCAAREVREEVGIEIANLRYFGSQSWPFPNSLMLAFVADYAGGEIVPEPGEIEAAGWFAPENLPLLPEPISISRRLIDAVAKELRG